MLECFLLLRHPAGGRWIAFFAIPLLISGGLASVRLMLSGVKGLLATRREPAAPGERSPAAHRPLAARCDRSIISKVRNEYITSDPD
jgi:hypothetical protein